MKQTAKQVWSNESTRAINHILLSYLRQKGALPISIHSPKHSQDPQTAQQSCIDPIDFGSANLASDDWDTATGFRNWRKAELWATKRIKDLYI